jgi:hypothetical protein
MLQGKIYMLSSPNHPKVYIGSTIQPMNKRMNRHRGRWNTCRSKVLYEACGDTVEVKILETIEVLNRNELQHHEVVYLKKYEGTLVNRNMPYRDRKQRYQENIVEMREYHRNRYQENAKKNGGDGSYRQLQRYHDQKESILRKCCLMNAWKLKRKPTMASMIKHNITEEDVGKFVASMENP